MDKTNERKMVTCSVCDKKRAKKNMKALAKKLGENHETVMVCKDCEAKFVREAVAESKSVPVFHYLIASEIRDKRFDEEGRRKQEYVLSLDWVPPELSQPDNSLRCTECGKTHGEYFYDRRARRIQVTVITQAMPFSGKAFNDLFVDFYVDAICNDCNQALIRQGKNNPRPYRSYDLLNAREEAETRNTEKKKRIDFIRSEKPSDASHQPKEHIPKAKRGQRSDGKDTSNQGLSTGTHDQ